MSLEPVVEAEASTLQDLRVQVTTVVDDDADRRVGDESPASVDQDVRDAVDVRADRLPAHAPRRAAELRLTALVQPQQLVRVPVLLVVVDQPRVRRRGDDAVEGPAEIQVTRVAVVDRRVRIACADRGEPLDAIERVEGVAEEEAASLFHRPARPPVLVAPVRLALRRPREVQIEVSRATRGARGASEDDPQDVGRGDLVDQ